MKASEIRILIKMINTFCSKLIKEPYLRRSLLLAKRYVFDTGISARSIYHDPLLLQEAKELAKSEGDDMPVSMPENPYEKEKRQCVLCKYKIKVDYKNIKLLSQFVSPYTGHIYDKHITGLCDHQQKALTMEIKRAQKAGFMAYILKDPRFLKDPKLFDPFNPQRPHPH